MRPVFTKTLIAHSMIFRLKLIVKLILTSTDKSKIFSLTVYAISLSYKYITEIYYLLTVCTTRLYLERSGY